LNPDNLPAGAQLMPRPTLPERHEINELLWFPRAYTHPVTLHNDNPHVGTAVFLRHGERLFAFTAAHNIREDTTIHFRLLAASERRLFDVLATYIHPDYHPDPFTETSPFDLAILELEPNAAVSAGDVRQLYTGEFGSLPAGQPRPVSEAFVWVVGFPCELARPEGQQITLYQTAFATQILELSDELLALHYPTSAYQMPHNGTTCEEGNMTLTPRGYSGGGVWVVRNPPGVMFDPIRHVKMVGVQTHWSSTSRRIWCVPSKVVVEAFRQFRPDLPI
jgi:hypothetical protein